MKRALLFTLAIVLGGLAQAISVTWDGDLSSGKNQTISNIDFTQAITVKLTYTVSEGSVSGVGPGGGNFFALCFNGTDVARNSLVVRNTNGTPPGTIVVNSGSGQGEDSGYAHNRITNLFAAGSHTLEFTVNLEGKTGSYTFDGGTPLPIKFPTNAFGFGEDLYITTGNLGGITLDKMEFRATVPEPTALALFALGVAGLALRRKVA